MMQSANMGLKYTCKERRTIKILHILNAKDWSHANLPFFLTRLSTFSLSHYRDAEEAYMEQQVHQISQYYAISALVTTMSLIIFHSASDGKM